MKRTFSEFLLLALLSSCTLSAHAEWMCYVADSHGHRWASTGSTEERATAVARSFCTAYSQHASTCHTSQCSAQ